MTVSRDRPARRFSPAASLVLAIAALSPFLSSAARAQLQQPEPTVTPSPPEAPPRAPVAVGPPTPRRPFDPTPRRAPGLGPQSAVPQIQGIEVNPLAEMDPGAIGALNSGQGGFGPAMWRDSDRTQIESLLLRLPPRMTSIALRDLARRLLLSSAPPPPLADAEGDAEAEAAAAADTDLLALRIDRLLALGDVEGLNRLLQAVPRRFDDQRILRGRVEGLVLAGDLTGGCREVRNGMALYHALPYWQKALVVCQLAAGERESAELGLGLMRERGLVEDPGFDALVDVMAGGDSEVPTATAIEPLNFAALQSIGWQPPAALINRAPPNLLAVIARSPRVPLEQRTVAAELAVAMGALDAEPLAELYRSFPFEPETLQEGDPEGAFAGPRQRALLLRRVELSDDTQARAYRIRIALETAAQSGLYRPMLQVLLPRLSEIPIESGTVWFAETAGRAHYASGGYERARSWYNLARDRAGQDATSASATARLWPYFRLTGGSSLGASANLAAWREARSDAGEALLARGEALLAAAFRALDEDGAPPLGSVAAADGAGAVSAENGLLLDLQVAGEDRRSGEAVLLTLVGLGEEGLEAAQPRTLNAVLTALLRIGLELEARQLAVEIAIANGI